MVHEVEGLELLEPFELVQPIPLQVEGHVCVVVKRPNEEPLADHYDVNPPSNVKLRENQTPPTESNPEDGGKDEKSIIFTRVSVCL